MRFNVEQYKKEPAYYRNMSRNAQAFHEAVHYSAYGCGDKIEIHGKDRIRNGKYKKRRTSAALLLIDRRTGEMTAKFAWNYQNDKALISREAVDEAMEDLLEILQACVDYGYIIPNNEKMHGYFVPIEAIERIKESWRTAP